MNKVFNVGLLGYGHIGKGVDKILGELSLRQPVRLVKIFDVPFKKEEIGERFCSSIDEIIDDPDIDIVIEALGGNTFPFECIKQSLKAKKHVVTSNKEVVAHHLKELLKLAHENDVFIQFEASCGGGIPLIRPLVNITKYDTVISIQGLLSSSVNLILTKTQDDKMPLEKAIRIAQEYGILEKDYKRDLRGNDQADKIAILSSLVYQTPIDPDNINVHGIENLTDSIIKDINSKGYYLKFIAESRLINNEVQISVEPIVMKKDNFLVSIKDDYNIVKVMLKNTNLLQFSGRGSGSLPASSAIASDVIRVIENYGYLNNVDLNNYKIAPYEDENTIYYVYQDWKSSIVSKDKLKEIDKIFYARVVK